MKTLNFPQSQEPPILSNNAENSDFESEAEGPRISTTNIVDLTAISPQKNMQSNDAGNHFMEKAPNAFKELFKEMSQKASTIESPQKPESSKKHHNGCHHFLIIIRKPRASAR
jgi:hypothetical protein